MIFTIGVHKNTDFRLLRWNLTKFCWKFKKILLKKMHLWLKVLGEFWSFFDSFLSYNVCNFWPKMYREAIFHDTEESCKIWIENDLCVWKWHKEFVKFSPEDSKVSELELLLGPFIQSRKSISYRGIM